MSGSAHVAPIVPGLHLPALGVGLAVMVGGTLYPLLMTDASPKADLTLAVLLSCAISAGFVRARRQR
jgi:hypothetical protein